MGNAFKVRVRLLPAGPGRGAMWSFKVFRTLSPGQGIDQWVAPLPGLFDARYPLTATGGSSAWADFGVRTPQQVFNGGHVMVQFLDENGRTMGVSLRDPLLAAQPLFRRDRWILTVQTPWRPRGWLPPGNLAGWQPKVMSGTAGGESVDPGLRNMASGVGPATGTAAAAAEAMSSAGGSFGEAPNPLWPHRLW